MGCLTACPMTIARGKAVLNLTQGDSGESPKGNATRCSVAFLRQQAAEHNPAIGEYVRRLLDSPLPWTRMRQVRALLSLVGKYGAERVAGVCCTALVFDLIDVRRLKLMLEKPAPPAATTAAPVRATVIPIARYLRDPSQYALPLRRRANTSTPEEPSDE
jgi:hypothetical protein